MDDASPRNLNDSTGDFQSIAPRPLAGRVLLEIDSATHRGLVRGNNEDSYLVASLSRSAKVHASNLGARLPRASDAPGHLLIVADGMGGVEGGERASALAVETLVGNVLNGFQTFARDRADDEETLARDLRAALDQADRAVLAAAETDPALAGMGTTVTLAYGLGDHLYIVHAGDSRAYLFRDGSLTQVTRDHTLVQMMVSGGLLAAEDARTHQRRNVVTNVIGGPSEGVFAEIHKLHIVEGDRFLLCSDGLSESVDDPAIAAILARGDAAGPTVAALIDAALAAGAPDNVTAILAIARAAG